MPNSFAPAPCSLEAVLALPSGDANPFLPISAGDLDVLFDLSGERVRYFASAKTSDEWARAFPSGHNPLADHANPDYVPPASSSGAAVGGWNRMGTLGLSGNSVSPFSQQNEPDGIGSAPRSIAHRGYHYQELTLEWDGPLCLPAPVVTSEARGMSSPLSLPNGFYRYLLVGFNSLGEMTPTLVSAPAQVSGAVTGAPLGTSPRIAVGEAYEALLREHGALCLSGALLLRMRHTDDGITPFDPTTWPSQTPAVAGTSFGSFAFEFCAAFTPAQLGDAALVYEDGPREWRNFPALLQLLPPARRYELRWNGEEFVAQPLTSCPTTLRGALAAGAVTGGGLQLRALVPAIVPAQTPLYGGALGLEGAGQITVRPYAPSPNYSQSVQRLLGDLTSAQGSEWSGLLSTLFSWHSLYNKGDVSASSATSFDTGGAITQGVAVDIGDVFVLLRQEERTQERLRRGGTLTLGDDTIGFDGAGDAFPDSLDNESVTDEAGRAWGRVDLLTQPFASAIEEVAVLSSTRANRSYIAGKDYELFEFSPALLGEVVGRESPFARPSPLYPKRCGVRWLEGGASPASGEIYTVSYRHHPVYLVDGEMPPAIFRDGSGAPLPVTVSIKRQHPAQV